MGNGKFIIAIILYMASTLCYAANEKHKRSIDLAAAHSLISDTKLPSAIQPNHYTLDIRPNFEDYSFAGTVTINVTVAEDTKEILMHAHAELKIQDSSVKVKELISEGTSKELKLRRVSRQVKKPIFEIHLSESLPKGKMYEIQIAFSGIMWEGASGLFRGSYYVKDNTEYKFVATHFRPNDARRMYPCFDEPGFKVPYSMKIARPTTLSTLFITPLKNTHVIEGTTDYVLDEFETTPPMSTYAMGFLISALQPIKTEWQNSFNINVYAKDDIKADLGEINKKVEEVMKSLSNYVQAEYPLKKLDIVALPGLFSVKPIDNWGLIIFKESELLSKGYYNMAQELIYNWLGNWITPKWWSDAHVNKALAGFIAAATTIEIDNGVEFEGKYPMTILYSLFYEFSKRYPHSRITGMKQETTCSKTELVLRMLNFTIGGQTFRKGIRKFIKDREYKTFESDDLWSALTQQAHADNALDESMCIKEIVDSWITKDRIPVINVKRDYKTKSALITQRVYLRERPHDVPEREKLRWWIPLIVAKQETPNFLNYTPMAWLKNEKQITLKDVGNSNDYIIVNPEEIGPFPVNYDDKNWNLLASFLLTEKRNEIPVYTRAKLLHDAWNLAYAGNLSFATALNMTLFMKHEQNHLVWNPVFTLIDHIGRHIDMSAVHQKFETYVTSLLSPLYEELGAEPKECEEKWKTNLRSLSKTFLCRAGYKPCIEESQHVYKKWMVSKNPDEGNPVANQYLCPLFKWGTMEEWEFGLQRVINFPESRVKSERTYLLKTLAGCPQQKEKIERLLNITILEENGNFTETDILLIFSMLTGGSNGYSTLFHFLDDNWDVIKQRFENKPTLWNNIVSSATGVFTTQVGYDMVSALYVKKQGEFGSAEHILLKSLKNIKEEAKWSDENLPVIENWLDNYSNQEKERESPLFMGKK